MCGCESWTIKKAEHWKIDTFELWCWRRLLRVPWSSRISNQSILKELSPEYSLEGLMLKLKLQYFGHLRQRSDSFEKTLMLGKIEGGRRGQQRMRWMASLTQWTWVWVNSRSCDGQGGLACCSRWGCKDWMWLSDWTELSASEFLNTVLRMSSNPVSVPESRLCTKYLDFTGNSASVELRLADGFLCFYNSMLIPVHSHDQDLVWHPV